MTTYYDRTATTHLDGSPVFRTAADQAAQTTVARQLEVAWSCTIQSFGELAPVDWYAVRHGRLVGVLELKHRSHTRDTYGTVFLNVRKWLALTMAAAGLRVPAIFVVQWTDQVGWVPLQQVDASRVRIGGCTRQVKAVSDVEPVIEVPVGMFSGV